MEFGKLLRLAGLMHLIVFRLPIPCILFHETKDNFTLACSQRVTGLFFSFFFFLSNFVRFFFFFQTWYDERHHFTLYLNISLSDPNLHSRSQLYEQAKTCVLIVLQIS